MLDVGEGGTLGADVADVVAGANASTLSIIFSFLSVAFKFHAILFIAVSFLLLKTSEFAALGFLFLDR